MLSPQEPFGKYYYTSLKSNPVVMVFYGEPLVLSSRWTQFALYRPRPPGGVFFVHGQTGSLEVD